MAKFKLNIENDLSVLKWLAELSDRLVYGAQTCWWKIGDPIYKRDNLPCGPRGEMLLETDKPLDFIKQAEENPDHYGRHGLEAFLAAYHGHIITEDGLPTSFESWDRYNDIIDEFDNKP